MNIKNIPLSAGDATYFDSRNNPNAVQETTNGYHEKLGGVVKRDGLTVSRVVDAQEIIGTKDIFTIQEAGDVFDNDERRLGKIIRGAQELSPLLNNNNNWSKVATALLGNNIHCLFQQESDVASSNSKEYKYLHVVYNKSTMSMVSQSQTRYSTSSLTANPSGAASDIFVRQDRVHILLKSSDRNLELFYDEIKTVADTTITSFFPSQSDQVGIKYSNEIVRGLYTLSSGSNVDFRRVRAQFNRTTGLLEIIGTSNISLINNLSRARFLVGEGYDVIYSRAGNNIGSIRAINHTDVGFTAASTTTYDHNNGDLNEIIGTHRIGNNYYYAFTKAGASFTSSQAYSGVIDGRKPSSESDGSRTQFLRGARVVVLSSASSKVAAYSSDYIFSGFTGYQDSFLIGKINMSQNIISFENPDETLLTMPPFSATQSATHLVVQGELNKDASRYFIPVLRKGTIISTNINGSTFGHGFDFIVFSKTETEKTSYRRIGGRVYLAGGVLKKIQNGIMTDVSFVEAPTLSIPTADDTATPLSRHDFVAIYERRNQDGQLDRSFLSNVVTKMITTSGNATKVLSFSVSNLIVGRSNDCNIKIYKTDPNGTVFYLLHEVNSNNSITNPVLNQEFTVTVVGNATTDVRDELPQGFVLYTGNISGNESLPISMPTSVTEFDRGLAVTQNSSAQGTVAFSNAYHQQNAPSIFFTYARTFYLESRARAIAELDAALIIFTENEIYSKTGTNAPRLISTAANLGAVNQNSVVAAQNEIIFQSDKGIYSISRGQVIARKGLPIKDYELTRVIRAFTLPDKNLTMLFQENGRVLVYNSEFNLWTTFIYPIGVDDVTIDSNGVLNFLISNKIYSESAANCEQTSLTVQTSDLMLSGQLLDNRLKEVQILGEFNKDSVVEVSFTYDYDGVTTSNQYTYTNKSIDELSNEGFYLNATHGTIVGNNIIRIKPKVQRCTSVKIKIVETSSGAASLNSLVVCYDDAIGKNKSFRGA